VTRRRAQAYRAAELSELTRQLLYAPPTKRAEVVRDAERLHDALEPSKNYPIDFVVYRLTQRRVPPSENVTLVGEALAPDLRLLIDALSRSIEMTPDADDPGETTAELAERLGVSTKTIVRWRDKGLRWRWAVREPGGKPTVLITRSAVSCFEERWQGRVASASSFSRLDEAEKARLIERARRLADATDLPPQRIIDHLSRRSGRSGETIRQLIARHDREHEGARVFADRAGPLTRKQKRVIDRAYRAGVGVARIGRRFRKTRSTVYRAIHELRAERVRARRIEPVVMPIFDRDDADEVILRPIKSTGRARRLDAGLLATLPEPLRPLFDRPIAPDAVCRSLLVRYNFLKYRARQAQAEVRASGVRAVDLDRFDELLRDAEKTRGQIVAGMLPVVLSVVRRQLAAGDDTIEAELIEMLGRGLTVLLDEIERFDPALSHTLESVLTNRLLRVLASAKPVAGALSAERLAQRIEAAGVEWDAADDA
jgi:transposase-like protein